MNEEYRQLMILEAGTNVCEFFPESWEAVPKSRNHIRKTGSPCVANAWTVLAPVRCIVFRYIPKGSADQRPLCPVCAFLFWKAEELPGCGPGRPVGRVERYRGYIKPLPLCHSL